MSTATLVSVEEYLTSSYRPDCDLVDGELIERNMGEIEHGELQWAVCHWFYERRHALALKALPEVRVRVRQDRFRNPDVSVTELPETEKRIITQPPYICIEVLSPEDTLRRMQGRIDDYLNMGTVNVWVIDPENKRAWSASRLGLSEALDGVLRTNDGRVEMKIEDLFQPWL